MNAGPLLVTMGDAAGIGPEIVWRAHRQGRLSGCVVLGDPAVLQRAARALDPASAPMAVIDEPADIDQVPPGCLPVLVPPGQPAGRA